MSNSNLYPEAEMSGIRQQIWYHGSITRLLAEKRLDDALQGTYLFRESETRPGFSLSLKVPEKVKHFMIAKKESGLWHLVGKQKEFDTIYTLIKYHSETETNSSDHTCLLYPCPAQHEDENPYVEMRDDIEVDEEALATARRLSEEAKKIAKSAGGTDRRGSNMSQTANINAKKKAHRYEHVIPKGSSIPE